MRKGQPLPFITINAGPLPCCAKACKHLFTTVNFSSIKCILLNGSLKPAAGEWKSEQKQLNSPLYSGYATESWILLQEGHRLSLHWFVRRRKKSKLVFFNMIKPNSSAFELPIWYLQEEVFNWLVHTKKFMTSHMAGKTNFLLHTPEWFKAAVRPHPTCHVFQRQEGCVCQPAFAVLLQIMQIFFATRCLPF